MNILAIDPGSTSTKIGVYLEGRTVRKCIEHPRHETDRFPTVMDQLEYRQESIDRYLADAGFADLRLDAVVGRGGLMKPVPGGVHLVNDAMVRDLRRGVSGEHASNLGGVLAQSEARRHGVQAYVVDPPVVDEMWPVARLSGLAGVERLSQFHALNQRASARDVAREIGQPYESLNLIVAHMASGTTVGAHCRGRVVDVNNGLNGDGPFAAERSGGLPVIGVLQLLERGECRTDELKQIVARRGGLYSYLGTNDMREVEKRVGEGDAGAALILDGMVYQLAKEIGALAAALDGDLDGIVLTGGLAYSEALVSRLSRKIGFLGKIFLRPGEFEIDALIGATVRVLEGLEPVQHYPEDDDEDRS